MRVNEICNAAWRREKPENMTLAEIKLYYSLVLVYTLFHLNVLTKEEGEKEKQKILNAYYAEEKYNGP